MWSTLLALAISLGASYLIDWFRQKKEEKDKIGNVDVSSAELYGKISSILNEARKRGSEEYNRVLDKLSNIPSLLGMSPQVKSLIQEARKKASAAVTKARNTLDDIERSANSIENQVTQLGAEPEYYKTSQSGKATLDRLNKESENLLTKIQEVETNV